MSLTKSQIHFNQALSPVAPLPVSFVIHITYYDTSVYIIVDLPEQAARILNADLQIIYQWANSWLVTFSPNKTASMIFSRKLNPVQHPMTTSLKKQQATNTLVSLSQAQSYGQTTSTVYQIKPGQDAISYGFLSSESAGNH